MLMCLQHNNLGVEGPLYIERGAEALLRHYPLRTQTRDEAFADVLSALSLLHTGKVKSNKRACTSASCGVLAHPTVMTP